MMCLRICVRRVQAVVGLIPEKGVNQQAMQGPVDSERPHQEIERQGKGPGRQMGAAGRKGGNHRDTHAQTFKEYH